jgi:hypothetical protein
MAVAAAGLVLAMPGAFAGESEWIELFNGKDLTGWEANKFPESFTVTEAGELRAQGVKGMTHLLYVGSGGADGLGGEDAIFKDFEMKATCRAEPNANSGIFFHTSFEMRNNKYLNTGYELQLNSTEKEKKKTGSLYAIKDLAVSPVDETEWFDVDITVVGKHIHVSINGEEVMDYEEPENAERPPDRAKRLISPTGGLIALQAHDPGSVFYFKDLKIRRLDGDGAAG